MNRSLKKSKGRRKTSTGNGRDDKEKKITNRKPGYTTRNTKIPPGSLEINRGRWDIFLKAEI